MRDLPSGTVTFLFTDIEGSTRLLHELGAEAYSEALAEHRRIVRTAVERHRGVEVDTEGDAFFVVFARASDAVAAAGEAQRALAEGPIRVRMGLHTGEPLVAEDNYVGIDVHRAARVMAAGHGGQVLVSHATRELLDERFELRDLGEHRMKDLSAPQRLYQLGDHDFPPLKTLYQTNLPVPATPFLGRAREVGEVLDLLREERLVTLTGPGGTGKTRLALQAAAEAAEDFEHGVFWVGLAPLRDPELVLPTIARAVGAHDDVASHIGDKRLLVLVDNFEHVIEAAPALGDLLSACPNSKLLVTSRGALHLEGEWEYAVQPLRQAEAVALFEQRARAISADFAAKGDVAEICERLDCLPLAVELAAARVKVLSPSAILERLAQRLPLLSGGARNAPERQRTLRATIEWSYDLLTPEERQLFARLALFAGGCTLAAAEEVCAADLETLESLVDKSLVRHSDGRYWMLETIREYASQHRRELPDADELRRRHARHFLAVAELEETRLLRGEELEALGRVSADLPNLRVALATALERDDGETALRLCGALYPFWYRGSYFEEGRYWSEQALKLDGPPEARERALGAAAEFALLQGATGQAREHLQERLARADEIGDPGRLSAIHMLLGHLAFAEANVEKALEEYAHALRLENETRERTSVWQSRAAALNNVGWALLHLNRLEEAQEHLEASLKAAQLEGTSIVRASALNNLARVALARRDLGALRDSLAQSLSVLQSAPDLRILSEWFALAARLLAAEGAPEQAAHAAGAASRLRDRLGVPPEVEPVPEVAWLEAAEAAVGTNRWESAFDAGGAAADEDPLATASKYLD